VLDFFQHRGSGFLSWKRTALFGKVSLLSTCITSFLVFLNDFAQSVTANHEPILSVKMRTVYLTIFTASVLYTIGLGSVEWLTTILKAKSLNSESNRLQRFRLVITFGLAILVTVLNAMWVIDAIDFNGLPANFKTVEKIARVLCSLFIFWPCIFGSIYYAREVISWIKSLTQRSIMIELVLFKTHVLLYAVICSFITGHLAIAFELMPDSYFVPKIIIQQLIKIFRTLVCLCYFSFFDSHFHRNGGFIAGCARAFRGEFQMVFSESGSDSGNDNSRTRTTTGDQSRSYKSVPQLANSRQSLRDDDNSDSDSNALFGDSSDDAETKKDK